MLGVVSKIENILKMHLRNRYKAYLPDMHVTRINHFIEHIKKSTHVRCGVRTHAPLREPELKSGALDRSANLTSCHKRP